MALNARIQAEYSIPVPKSIAKTQTATRPEQTDSSDGAPQLSAKILESTALTKVASTLIKKDIVHESATALVRIADERKVPKPKW